METRHVSRVQVSIPADRSRSQQTEIRLGSRADSRHTTRHRPLPSYLGLRRSHVTSQTRIEIIPEAGERCWTCLGLFLLIVCSVLHSTGSVCSVRLQSIILLGTEGSPWWTIAPSPNTSKALYLTLLRNSSIYRTPWDGSIPSFSTPLSCPFLVRDESSLNHRPSASSARILQSSPLRQWLDPLVSQWQPTALLRPVRPPFIVAGVARLCCAAFRLSSSDSSCWSRRVIVPTRDLHVSEVKTWNCEGFAKRTTLPLLLRQLFDSNACLGPTTSSSVHQGRDSSNPAHTAVSMPSGAIA